MKKVLFFCVLMVFILAYLHQGSSLANFSITGDTITGKATTQSTNLVVNVTSMPLNLIIYSPQNKTYLTNNSLLLNFSVSAYMSVWFSIDGGANTTLIDNNHFFNTTQGNHTLIIYANNTDGNIISRRASFTANSTLKVINYTNYAGQGQSTEFIRYHYDELQNLSNVVFHIPLKGKIVFKEQINLSNVQNSDIVDINLNVIIESNSIEIKTDILKGLNRSASLYLYNLSFSNPVILRNSEPCPESICAIESYSGGTLKFNVTGFSAYSAGETSVSLSPSQNAGSGGGGGNAEALSNSQNNFSVSKEAVSIKLKSGETKSDKIIIKNNFASASLFTIKVFGIDDITRVRENSFYISPGEEKELIIDFLAREGKKEGTYIGKIVIESNGISREFLASVGITSKKGLFDIDVSIPDRFSTVVPGGTAIAQINLYNLGQAGRVDAILIYELRNSEGKIIKSYSETLAVETRAELIKIFDIPKDTKESAYLIVATVKYGDETASSSEWFTVKNGEFSKIDFLAIGVTVAFIIFSIIIINQNRSIKRISKHIELKVSDKMNAEILARNKLIRMEKTPEQILARAFRT